MNKTKLSILMILALLAGLAVFAVACGDDDDSSSRPPNKNNTTNNTTNNDNNNNINPPPTDNNNNINPPPTDNNNNNNNINPPPTNNDDNNNTNNDNNNTNNNNNNTNTGTQGVTPLVGKCYDHEAGGTEGDGSGCYGIAMSTLCAADIAACEGDAACTAMEDCNSTCNGLSGDEWQTCSNNCKASNAAGLPLFEAYQKCIYCDACAVDCKADANGKGCAFTVGACAEESTKCYGDEADGRPACWGCAMANDCKAEADACTNSADCGALEACLEPCNAAGGPEWQSCTDACKATHASAVAILDAYHKCIYCTAGCKTLCPTDGPSCM